MVLEELRSQSKVSWKQLLLADNQAAGIAIPVSVCKPLPTAT